MKRKSYAPGIIVLIIGFVFVFVGFGMALNGCSTYTRKTTQESKTFNFKWTLVEEGVMENPAEGFFGVVMIIAGIVMMPVSMGMLRDASRKNSEIDKSLQENFETENGVPFGREDVARKAFRSSMIGMLLGPYGMRKAFESIRINSKMLEDFPQCEKIYAKRVLLSKIGIGVCVISSICWVVWIFLVGRNWIRLIGILAK